MTTNPRPSAPRQVREYFNTPPTMSDLLTAKESSVTPEMTELHAAYQNLLREVTELRQRNESGATLRDRLWNAVDELYNWSADNRLHLSDPEMDVKVDVLLKHLAPAVPAGQRADVVDIDALVQELDNCVGTEYWDETDKRIAKAIIQGRLTAQPNRGDGGTDWKKLAIEADKSREALQEELDKLSHLHAQLDEKERAATDGEKGTP